MDIPLLGGGNSGLPDLGGIDKEELKNGPRDKLIICSDCRTIEHIPGSDLPMEHDQPLQARLRNHLVPLAEGVSTHAIAFTTVNAKLWKENEEFRRYITRAITEAQKTGNVGLGDEVYDLRSTFAEDAMKCWRIEHNRTQNCQDYMSDKKRLVPPTKADRRELGLETRSKQIYSTMSLCQFCPFHRIAEDRARRAQGYY